MLDRFVVQEFLDLDRQEVSNPVTDGPGRFRAYTEMGLYMLGGEPIRCRASRDPLGKGVAVRPTFVTTAPPMRMMAATRLMVVVDPAVDAA
jgi:hypothetical protein